MCSVNNVKISKAAFFSRSVFPSSPSLFFTQRGQPTWLSFRLGVSPCWPVGTLPGLRPEQVSSRWDLAQVLNVNTKCNFAFLLVLTFSVNVGP